MGLFSKRNVRKALPTLVEILVALARAGKPKGDSTQ